jgi:predicted nuclease of restriction endonuclease-like (RecB) superfamily
MFYYNLVDSEYRSVRILKSEIRSHLYQRQLAGKVVKEVLSESKQLEGQGSVNQIVVSDPYVLDFLGLKDDQEYSETKWESRIILHLQRFLLELGRGFAFVSRQQRISIDGSHFRADLVFYNYILKCFVIVDLKTRKIDLGDIGQMQMYVNFYDREIISEGDNKTIGIIIAEEKDDTVVKFTLPLDNQQIFTTRYSTIIPSEN